MTEVVAALIWEGEKFMICQREIPNYAFCPADEEILKKIIEVCK